MEHYRDWDNDSNIVAYEIGPDFITVEFRNGPTRFYTYTFGSAGAHAVEEMSRLARAGDGLNAYINEHKPGYASKR